MKVEKLVLLKMSTGRSHCFADGNWIICNVSLQVGTKDDDQIKSELDRPIHKPDNIQFANEESRSFISWVEPCLKELWLSSFQETHSVKKLYFLTKSTQCACASLDHVHTVNVIHLAMYRLWIWGNNNSQ